MDYELQIRMTALNQASTQVDAVSKSVGNLGSSATKTASGGLNNFGKKMESLGSRINVLGQRMTWMVSVPLLAFGKKSVDTYLDIEKSFLRLEKVFQGTVEEIENIKKSAFELSTKFGQPVEDITEIMINFNKAGINSTEDLKSLADIVTQTSIMFDTDMSSATKGVTSLMFGFKLSVEQTKQALADINLIADTTTGSEAGMLEVLNKVAGVARNAGASIREIAAAQAVFEASAIPAGRAGNALKSILVSLDKTSNKAKDQFRALGVDMDAAKWKTSSWTEKMDALKKVYDEVKAKGDKKIFGEFIKNVEKATKTSDDFDFSQTTVIEKLKLLRATLVKAQQEGDKDTFEKISKQLELLNLAGDGPIEKITDLDDRIKILASSGNTEDMADLNEAIGSFMGKFQISNFDVLLGGWDDFKTILEETKDPAVAMERWAKGMNKYLESDVIKIEQLNQKYREQQYEIGQKIFPIYEKVIDFLGKMLEKFNNLSPETQDWIIKLGILAAVLGPVLAFAGLLTSSLGFLFSAISFTAGGVSGLIGGTSILSGILSVLAPIVGVALLAAFELFVAFLVAKAIVAVVNFKEEMDNMRKASEENRKKLDELKGSFDTLSTDKANEQFRNAWNEADKLQKINEDLQKRYEGWPGVWNAFKDGFEEMSVDLTDRFLNAADKMEEMRKKFISAVGDKASDAGEWLKKKLGYATGGVVKGYNSGGMVYATNGFLAKGRDIVPAMLSPGEMVLNKSQQSKLFDVLAGRTSMQTSGGPTVNINVGTMVASRGEQREFARRIEQLIGENNDRY